jgi:hypothetical protein
MFRRETTSRQASYVTATSNPTMVKKNSGFARALAAVLLVGTAALVGAEADGTNVLTLTADSFDQAVAVCI